MTSNQTTVNKGSNGQFKTTVPQGLASAMDLDGKKIEWSIESGSRMTVSVQDE